MVQPSIGFPALFVATVLYSGLAHPHCGGEERWPVKVGNDPTASKVRVDQPIASKIETLLKIPMPTMPADETTRMHDELSVYRIQGRLVKFKLETGKTGDMDYHLVVSDDTLKYTDDKANQKPGHSIIAEIPDPNCFAGREGTGANDSVFKDRVVQARAQLEAQFPKISKTKWNDAGGILVEITGVAFFDRPHGQTGRATNNLELHPVLSIKFTDGASIMASPTDSGAAEPREDLLRNPGFEEGASGWVASDRVISDDKTEKAHRGSWKAWLGGYGRPHTDSMYQEVSIPKDAGKAELSFYMNIQSQESEKSHKVHDDLKLQIRDKTGKWIKTAARYSNLDETRGYVRETVDLSAYRGKTIRINFVATEDDGGRTSFLLDDFALSLQR